ncbi:MAG: DUF3369 domain-containing protein [Proteobacteria bacterium]|nr:DUF3369 domain-containing protein [Pseudomonadota bacterium]
MEKENTPNISDDLIKYKKDDISTTSAQSDETNPWKIIIADDEKEVHEITKMVLSDYIYEGHPLKFYSTYSMSETIALLEKEPHFAIILLDVVMEEDDSGLQVAQYIRETLRDSFLRIILRTGQPGKAPERSVIMEYDINDYKSKTELTAQKLFTAITTSLRSYRDIRIIDKNRKGLEQIIHSSTHLFEFKSMKKFATGVLTQLLSILRLDEDSLYIRNSAFAVDDGEGGLIILAATGKFENYVDQPVHTILPEIILERLRKAVEAKTDIFEGDAYIGYFHTKKNSQNLIYMTGCSRLGDMDRNLLRIFASNVAIAFDNVSLSRELVATQKEIIFTLGEIVETRSTETANHVLRVSVFSELLSNKAGLSDSQTDLLKLASPMHDIGKIGVPDAILNKPSRLTPEEFDIIKLHTTVGYSILQNSEREIMQAAAIIALQHHERWDGFGYPKGLSGKDIHIFGRITAIADVFDALSHKRIYKEPWSMENIITLFRDEQGKSFDPELTQIFLDNQKKFMEINAQYPETNEPQKKSIW